MNEKILCGLCVRCGLYDSVWDFIGDFCVNQWAFEYNEKFDSLSEYFLSFCMSGN